MIEASLSFQQTRKADDFNCDWRSFTGFPLFSAASCNLFLLDLNPSGGAGTIRAGTGDGTQIGSIVDYECDDGYEMDGDPIVICQDNGQWSANSPECKSKLVGS